MPDISMCTGGNCPIKNECYRYRAVPSEYRQSYMNPPYNKEVPFKATRERVCDYYMKILKGDRLEPITDKVFDGCLKLLRS